MEDPNKCREMNLLPDTEFVLYRILGNSLPPRHDPRNMPDNLGFILRNEPELEGCVKRWVLNRIVDRVVEDECIRMIDAAGHGFIRIPFDLDEYATRFLDGSDMPPELLLPAARNGTMRIVRCFRVVPDSSLGPGQRQ